MLQTYGSMYITVNSSVINGYKAGHTASSRMNIGRRRAKTQLNMNIICRVISVVQSFGGCGKTRTMVVYVRCRVHPSGC